MAVLSKRCALAFALAALPFLMSGAPQSECFGGGKAKEGDREADRAAIAKATASFLQALEKGDAKALAAHWTMEGEFVHEDGVTVRGRAELEKTYAEVFKKRPIVKVRVDMESLHFTSRDTAIEEGHVQVTRVIDKSEKSDKADKGDKSEETTSSKYTILHVREDDKWLMAVLREWPSEATSLHELDWLIGAWVAKGEKFDIRASYAWDLNKSFIRGQFTITEPGRSVTMLQIIGKDPSQDSMRSWSFDSEGGIGDATWGREGKRWILDARAVLSDGRVLSQDNIMTPLDADSFTWQSVNRSVGEEELPDIAPVKVTRVKGKK